MKETQSNDESIMNSKQPTITGQVDAGVMRIFEEDFNWYQEDRDWFVEHPKWSLVGMGSTLQDAHRDLINELKMTQELFCNISDEELTEEAKRMKYWLKPLRFKIPHNIFATNGMRTLNKGNIKWKTKQKIY